MCREGFLVPIKWHIHVINIITIRIYTQYAIIVNCFSYAYVQAVCLFKLDVNALQRCGSLHIRYTRMSGWQMTVPPFKRRGPPEPLHADETGFDVFLKPKREQRWLLTHTLHCNVWDEHCEVLKLCVTFKGNSHEGQRYQQLNSNKNQNEREHTQVFNITIPLTN